MELLELHLFAGAGGGILGGHLLGHRVIGAVEIEAYPRKVLLARQLDGSLPRFPIWDDVTTFRLDNPDTRNYIERLQSVRDRLVICGGFPCQPHSASGSKRGTSDERWLWDDIERIIAETDAEYVFLENVPGVIHNGAAYKIMQRLSEIGYDSIWDIISAGYFGYEHERERVWILANANRSQCKRRGISGRVRQENSIISYPRRGKDKSGVDRMANGVANRMDRLKAIGNGQVSRVACVAFRILKERLEQ